MGVHKKILRGFPGIWDGELHIINAIWAEQCRQSFVNFDLERLEGILLAVYGKATFVGVRFHAVCFSFEVVLLHKAGQYRRRRPMRRGGATHRFHPIRLADLGSVHGLQHCLAIDLLR